MPSEHDLPERAARLDALRAAMRAHRIDAFVVPSSDPHLSEYLPQRWKGREWLSGFTGSVGTFIATQETSGVWTDARYWEQAEAELAGSATRLMKIPSGASTLWIDWLADSLPQGATAAVDARVLGLSTARALSSALQARGVQVRFDTDLLDGVWSGRPDLPSQPVFEHGEPYCRLARSAKLETLRAEMARHGATHHFISTLDDIAYLFNLRGSDVSFNPVFLAHALVTPQGATLFVAPGKLDAGLAARLAADGVTLSDYHAAAGALSALAPDAVLLLDPRRVTAGMRDAVAHGVRVIEAINPTTLAKSRKTEQEAIHIRATMEQDGAALCEFFAWLETALDERASTRLTELDIDHHITAARSRRPGFVSPSFATIAGFNANGAIMHYRATQASHSAIEGEGLLLIDSGGQYHGGTTDITRVVAVGTPSPAQMRDFTHVLKGLIALSSAQFPRGTRSPLLDTLARAPIWAGGAEYGHGTGHGVGYFLNVHEGPQSISPSTMPEPHTAMEPGMITSIEPGIYRPGRWGIRIENLAMNVAAGSTEFGEFLRFETLTLCPIDTRCLDRSVMTAIDIAWLNDYHTTVRQRLMPHVTGAAREWLRERTEPV